MQWQGINEFSSVAETGSFTLAAKRLKLSTSQISKQITALEQRLNSRLFYRTTRKVSLTEEGKLFYQHCRQILDALDEAEQAINNLQSVPRGNIKLTAPVTYAEQTLLPLINDFLQLYPDIQIQVNLTNNREDLIEGAYDMAIRIGKLGDSSLIARKLGSRAHITCASPHYLQQHQAPKTARDLHQHNCLTGASNQWRFVEKGKSINLELKGNLSCNSGRGLVDAALKGLGIIQLPDHYVQAYIHQRQLLPLLSQQQRPAEDIWVLTPQNRHLSAKVNLFINFLKQHLTQT